jgi:hypothetical protein
MKLNGGFIDIDSGITLAGTVSIRDLNAAVPWSVLQPFVARNGVRADIALQLERLDIANGWPVRIQGSVDVSSLLVRELAATPIGSYRAEFQTSDGAISGSVADVAGILDVAATIRLTADRNYSLVGQVAAAPGAPASLSDQLRYLGTPDARGLREFRFEGSL